MKTVTKEFLQKHDACNSGMEWVIENKLIGLTPKEFIDKLMTSGKFSWANWLIVRLMNKKQKVMYAIFAAEQVLHIFEERYKNDLRPRKAVEAAKAYLKNPSKKTKQDAYAAAHAATAARAAAHAASAAAYAYATAYAAAADAHAAAAAADAAADAYAAAYAADAADAYAAEKQMQITIINYGLTLIN